jgi:hypothetical protein
MRDRLNATMINIYRDLSRQVCTPFVWVVEDDTIPPLDACERLMGCFNDSNVASVSGAYLNNPRFDLRKYVAWRDCSSSCPLIERKGNGPEKVEGNGFGCVIMRSEYFKMPVQFIRDMNAYEFYGYDMQFYRSLSDKIVKVHWDVECEHLLNDVKVI